MNLGAVTASVICADVVAMVAYDVWVKLREPDGNATISWVLLTAGRRVPILVFAFGVLFGHIFAPNCP